MPSDSAPRPDTGPRYTAVASDVHVSDFEPVDPRRPAWRRFKHADLSRDDRLVAFLTHLMTLSGGEPVELIYAGDTFDFDTIVTVPDPAPFPVTWLEKKRGLASEEAKSVWKVRRIVACHPTWFEALHRWVLDGNRLVFMVGNHDLDLHWPAVQAEIVAAIDPPSPASVTFCEFFRIAGGDTLVMHGNQFDTYCVVHDPLHPFIEMDGSVRVRSPFGNLAGKMMLNGMGFFNPHVESSFIRPLGEYASFFFRYILRFQPLLVWSWFWTAAVTLWVTLDEGFRPARREPSHLEARLADVARRANSTPGMTQALREMAVHPAVFSPWKVARELWLDRAALLLLLVAVVFQVESALHWLGGASPWWSFAIFVTLLPLYFIYARSCRSEVGNTEANIHARIGELARIAKVSRVVMGHTHRAGRRDIEGVPYLNTGHWSSAYDDVECTIPVGTNGFAWIHPGATDTREIELRAFDGAGSSLLEAPPEPLPDVLATPTAVHAA